MDVRSIKGTVFALACLANVAGLLQFGPGKTAAAADKAQAPFQKKELAENVWRIEELGAYGGVNMYLALGKKNALLIDAGYGLNNPGPFVKTITALPVLVVNTHGHYDHAGGNGNFTKIFAHPADFPLMGGMKGAAGEITPVRDGYVFDLGGRKLAVVETPGHTPGSICLLDAEHRMLFTGDNNNSHTWMFLRESTPLETYLKTLEKLIARSSEFDVLYPGHGGQYVPEYLKSLLACGQRILKGECQGTPYQSYSNARSCSHRGALIAFDPDRLFEKN